MDRMDALAILGLALLVAGVALVFVPAAFVIAGVVLLAVARTGSEAS
jgi:hypothetical protein